MLLCMLLEMSVLDTRQQFFNYRKYCGEKLKKIVEKNIKQR